MSDATEEAIELMTAWTEAIDTHWAQQRVDAGVAANAERDAGSARPALPVTEAELVQTAFHEAAHACIAHAVGCDLSRVCIRADGSGATEHSSPDLLASILARLAAPVAELIAGADDRRRALLAASYDVQSARLMIDQFRANGGACNLPTHTFATMAASAVLTNWPSICRTGAALRALGELSGAEVAAFCVRAH